MATLRGTQDDDELFGDAEDDRILGGLGNDRLFGGRGDDVLVGGRDNDVLAGGRGNDRLFGGPGNDRLFGGPGNDDLRGGLGNDALFGALGNDRMFGNAGDDELRGGLGRDRMVGGNGDDRLVGQGGPDILTGGAGADRFVYGSLNHAGDRITDFNPDDGDLLALIGPLNGADMVMVDDGTDTTVSVRPTGEQSFTELVVLENFVEGPSSAGPIDVWYGDIQAFGDPGVPQQWVNILGNVSPGGLSSLTWSLNDGLAQDLATGPNNNRLPRPGDFNVELDYDQLDPTAADDVVTIRAAYNNGDLFERDVLIDYEGGRQWPTDYGIEWSQVTDLQDVVQVVDGKWSFDGDGVRPEIPGYDRILAIGDQNWDSYEARLSIHMNSLDTVAQGRDAAIWLGMQWGGHTDDPRRGDLDGPHEGWVPGATFKFAREVAELRPSEFFFRDVDGDGINDNRAIGADNFQIQDGRTYNFLVRNERVAGDTDLSDGLDRTYSVKVWEVGAPEPNDWLLSKTMIDQEPFGSFLLNAHHLDVTFGDIRFVEIPLPALQVSDVLQSDDNLEPLLATGTESGPANASMGGAGTGSGSGAAAPLVALSDPMINAEDPALAA